MENRDAPPASRAPAAVHPQGNSGEHPGHVRHRHRLHREPQTVRVTPPGERQAINAPLQGTAADIIKKAMIRLPDALKAAGLGAKMLLQVHDELIFEAKADEAEATAALVKSVMEGVVTLSIPLTCEAGIGQNWGAAH